MPHCGGKEAIARMTRWYDAVFSSIEKNLNHNETVINVTGQTVEHLRQTEPHGVIAEWDSHHHGQAGNGYRAMLHAGLITEDSYGNCHIPISSLRTHVEEKTKMQH